MYISLCVFWNGFLCGFELLVFFNVCTAQDILFLWTLTSVQETAPPPARIPEEGSVYQGGQRSNICCSFVPPDGRILFVLKTLLGGTISCTEGQSMTNVYRL